MGSSPDVLSLLNGSPVLAPGSVLDPYRLEDWSISRFQGDPPVTKFLVEDFLPLGIAGTIYSPGGTGKSTLALDLALRVSIAHSLPTPWLGRFQVPVGGSVLYLSAEEPEEVLHRRVFALSDVLGEEVGLSGEAVRDLVDKRLSLVNLWGKVEPLFRISATTLDPTPEYERVRVTLLELEKVAKVRLIVFDTRSRLSGAEGAGNGLVSREVTYFEKLACEFGATVLILHHTSKASYAGGMAANQAVRGESAFLDSLRFGVHIQGLSADEAREMEISEEERARYLVVSNSKQNYTELKAPIVLRREGFRFIPTDLAPRPEKGERKAQQEKKDMEKIRGLVLKEPGRSQNHLLHEAMKRGVSMNRGREALKNAEAIGLIEVRGGERGAKLYYPAISTEEDNKGDLYGD